MVRWWRSVDPRRVRAERSWEEAGRIWVRRVKVCWAQKTSWTKRRCLILNLRTDPCLMPWDRSPPSMIGKSRSVLGVDHSNSRSHNRSSNVIISQLKGLLVFIPRYYQSCNLSVLQLLFHLSSFLSFRGPSYWCPSSNFHNGSFEILQIIDVPKLLQGAGK